MNEEGILEVKPSSPHIVQLATKAVSGNMMARWARRPHAETGMLFASHNDEVELDWRLKRRAAAGVKLDVKRGQTLERRWRQTQDEDGKGSARRVDGG